MLKYLVLVATLVFFVPIGLAANTGDPYEQTNRAAKELFTAFNKQKASINKNPNVLKRLVRQHLLPYIQVKYSAVLIIGSYYENASSQQKSAYFEAFEDYLVYALSGALSFYDGQSYSIEGKQDLSGKDLVSVRVLLSNSDKNVAPIRLDFQWRKNSITGEWKAYDMIAEGVSMISTKQNEWASVLRNGGLPALTRQLKREASQPIKLELR